MSEFSSFVCFASFFFAFSKALFNDHASFPFPLGSNYVSKVRNSSVILEGLFLLGLAVSEDEK